MTLKEYQERAMTTCLPHSKNASYMLLNLVGEVGEIAGKVSKVIRKGEAHFTGCWTRQWTARLERLIIEGKVRAEKGNQQAQNGKWLCNAADVLFNAKCK